MAFNPVWNVFKHNINKKEIETFNVFAHSGFRNECKKAAKKYHEDKDLFAEEIRRSLMYFYWSRAEYEVLICDFLKSNFTAEKKVDIYQQVMLNWNIFAEYCWERRDDFAND